MSRLIDADELRKNVLKWMPSDPCGKEEKEFPFETDICASMVMEIDDAPTVQPDTTTHDSIPAETGKNDGDRTSGDCISRTQAIEVLRNRWLKTRNYEGIGEDIAEECEIYLKTLPSVQPDLGKYEYHYDHTDCIWYRPEARNRCPVTCAQYRDGWNDAMNYIFRDGKGYRPYRRGEQYEE